MVEYNMMVRKTVELTIKMSLPGYQKFYIREPDRSTSHLGVWYRAEIDGNDMVTLIIKTDTANAIRLKLAYDRT